ncbi:uncharacterized protein K460DRAFT_401756 [Cucurbitaria berberidis CBS 394.84]|uniref:Uncharacterized protein n=1 Tax=Cucurbitaria berberidis CBS 394.84 TaxID=1168544 RepID=A0A9P4GUX7_9PLEO|nr:uncharacterized protein K460DRAFT_401756 [Cucurbitaria berberidis CBS 394.84]KAF1851739.1 hypothetical protein K460DRAFT_401756 [Cucurbitaria berberidis CBS 394.84]
MARVEKQNREIREVIKSSQDPGVSIDQIARIRGWFRPQDDSVYYPVVQDYVNEKIDIKEASSKIFNPIEEKILAKKLDDVNFMDLWYSIIHSARRISFRQSQKHDRVVDLVAAFKNHEMTTNTKYNYLFSSLTDFSMACREAYNDVPEAHDGFFKEEVDAWTSLNFFFARITAKGLGDFAIFSIWAMREALETDYKDNAEATAVQQYDAYVPAAATWVLGMGRDLPQQEKDLTPTDPNQGDPARGGELWKGKSEFSKERWMFWKKRFTVVGEMKEVAEETRDVARDVVQYMERAETFEHV